MTRIVIVIEGGLVSQVLSDEPIGYCQIDYDGDDSSALDEETVPIPQLTDPPSVARAFASVGPEDQLSIYHVDRFFRAVSERAQ